MMSTHLQVYEREASARQLEVGQLRKTGEAHRRRVKLLEQELASQRMIAKVCSGQHGGWGASCVPLLDGLSLLTVCCATQKPNC